MEINWFGLNCFRITERGQATIITDPHNAKSGLTLPKLKGDIVTTSNGAVEAISGSSHTIDGPGEYEISGIFIWGTATHKNDSRNIHFSFDYDGLTVAHLGRIAKVPSQTQVEALGEVNVLLLPIGGGDSLTAVQAAEVVSMIEPNYVIPMYYKTKGVKAELEGLDRFLKEMGVTEYEAQESLKVTTSGLPEETQTVVLTPKE